jgi:hypothetical protein|tara:strand:+ start:2276 stop:2701 length:426 start_codon:yes stop_codon:yes gene_type:complete
MKAIGINGREYTWNLNGYNVPANDTRKRSKYHMRARSLLREIFHSYRILEEVKLPGSTVSHRKGVLFLDFLIPQIKLGIEVHGQQHYEYTPFFHKNKADFVIAKAKDEDKIEWCELNKVDLIVLKYSDTDAQWREQIENGE